MIKRSIAISSMDDLMKFMEALESAAQSTHGHEKESHKDQDFDNDMPYALNVNMVDDCIVDERNGKVVLKILGDVYVAQVMENDTFNAEVGVLWCLAKFVFDLLGKGCSAKNFVDGCLAIADSHKNRQKEKKEQQKTTQKAASKCEHKQPSSEEVDLSVSKELNELLQHLTQFYGGKF